MNITESSCSLYKILKNDSLIFDLLLHGIFLSVVTCPLPVEFSEDLSSLSGNCDAGSSIEFNTTCTFECPIGYTLSGSDAITCQSDGTLSASLPNCNGKSYGNEFCSLITNKNKSLLISYTNTDSNIKAIVSPSHMSNGKMDHSLNGGIHGLWYEYLPRFKYATPEETNNSINTPEHLMKAQVM